MLHPTIEISESRGGGGQEEGRLQDNGLHPPLRARPRFEKTSDVNNFWTEIKARGASEISKTVCAILCLHRHIHQGSRNLSLTLVFHFKELGEVRRWLLVTLSHLFRISKLFHQSRLEDLDQLHHLNLSICVIGGHHSTMQLAQQGQVAFSLRCSTKRASKIECKATIGHLCCTKHLP